MGQIIHCDPETSFITMVEAFKKVCTITIQLTRAGV
jgi:hypothetical protein